MKKTILICVSLILIAVCIIGIYAVQSSKIIGETVVPVTETPFVYYCPFAPNEYYFLDADGNKLD